MVSFVAVGDVGTGERIRMRTEEDSRCGGTYGMLTDVSV